ncbi:MAG: GTP-binding protein [Pseudomonadota bacterium]|nr:GTP-binding protein [Pseudomonadota bacterium]
MTQPSPHDRLPISVITGFLGAGKSTLLGKLIQHADMDRVAVIVNEFGEVGIDHALVSKVDEETVLLNSGCLCCTVRGDLLDTLKRLVVQREEKVVADFDRVLVETTGLADPAPILHTMMSDPFLVSRFRLDGVITVVDAANAAWQMDNHGEAIKQAAVADRLVLSKADLASAEARAATERRLSALNPAAPILPAVQGDLAPGQLFDAGLYNPATKSVDVARWLREEAYRDQAGHVYHRPDDHGHGHGHDHHHHDVNRHDDRIHAFCLQYDTPLTWHRVAGALDLFAQTHGANLLRLKGLLNLTETDNPVVVHAVQHMFHPPAQLEGWPDDDRRSRLVFIVKDLDQKTVQNIMNSYLAVDML